MVSRLSSVVRSSRGSAGQEYVIAALAIGLSGLLGMQTLGGSMGAAIATGGGAASQGGAAGQTAARGLLVSTQAGTDALDVGKGNGKTSSVEVETLTDAQITKSLARTKDALAHATSNDERKSLEAGVLTLRREQTRRAFAGKSDQELQSLKAQLIKTLALRKRDLNACVAGKKSCPNDVAFARDINDAISVEQARRADLAAMPTGTNSTTATGNGKFVPTNGSATGTETKTSNGKSFTESIKDPIRPSVLVSPEEARQSAMDAAMDGTIGGVEGAVGFAADGISGLFTPVKWLFWDTWHGADIGGDIKRFIVGAFKSPPALLGAIRDSSYECLAGDDVASERGNACGRLISTALALGGGGWKGTKYAKLIKQAENLEALAKEAGLMGKLGKLAVKFSDTKWGTSLGEWWRTKRGAAAAAKAAAEADTFGPGAEIGIIKHADDAADVVAADSAAAQNTALASTKLDRLVAQREVLVGEHNALVEQGVRAQAKAGAAGMPYSQVMDLPEIKAFEHEMTRLQRRVEKLDGQIAAERARK